MSTDLLVMPGDRVWERFVGATFLAILSIGSAHLAVDAKKAIQARIGSKK
jgi:hypothetical protein